MHSPIYKEPIKLFSLLLAVLLLTSCCCNKTQTSVYKKNKPQSFFYQVETEKQKIIKELNKRNIEYIQYGDNITLIIPVDHYFNFNTNQLSSFGTTGLAKIIQLIQLYPLTPIYVAAFSDDVGSREYKNKLTQAQAETMVAYLWANNISSARLYSEGYGKKHTVGQNTIVHGSAYNRRIELQWSIKKCLR